VLVVLEGGREEVTFRLRDDGRGERGCSETSDFPFFVDFGFSLALVSVGKLCVTLLSR
jgi:hypothetical protein